MATTNVNNGSALSFVVPICDSSDNSCGNWAKKNLSRKSWIIA
jgi:hypothetical protein